MTTHVHEPAPTPRSNLMSPVAELEISGSSGIDNIRPMVDGLMRFMQPLFARYSDTSAFEVELAMHEAVANAIVHGNDQDSSKRVYVHCRYTMDGEVWITVRDEGEGFDHSTIPDPTDLDKLLLNHGRGIHMMRALMDEVAFANRGTVVSMRKALRHPSG